MSDYPVKKIALFDYEATNYNEISLKKGEEYTIESTNDKGWFHVKTDQGVSGWSPSNFFIHSDDKSNPSPPDEKPPNDTDTICKICNELILDTFVIANSKKYHVKCFNCNKCKSELAGESFIEKESKFFCEKCFHDMYSPKCGYCNEPITGQYISALNNSWHPNHFLCCNCGNEFKDDSFRKAENKPYCEACFKEKFSMICTKCLKPINDKVYSTKDNNYHGDCFVCEVDKEKLKDTDNVNVKEGKLYCSVHFKELFSKNCFTCKENIEGKFITVLSKDYHEKCFKCEKCDNSLLNVSYQLKDEKLICKSHIEEEKRKEQERLEEEKMKEQKRLEEEEKMKEQERLEEEEEKMKEQERLEEEEEKMKEQEGEIKDTYSYEILKNLDKCPKNVPPNKREDYLTSGDFQSIFEMTKKEFNSLPLWKQRSIKKKRNLF